MKGPNVTMYSWNKAEAMNKFREKFKNLVPIDAKKAGTKHGAPVYVVWYKKRKRMMK